MESVKFPHNEAAFLRAKILLVDDDETLLGILKRWLGHSGYVVEAVPSGLEAIQELRAQAFEVVIIDLQLPDLNGLQLLTIIKELQPSIEVIMLSGQGTMDDAIQALREGRSFDFLRKPLTNLHELNLTINKALIKQRPPLALEKPQPAPGEPPVFDGDRLSEREIEILRLVARGHDNREIARQLVLSDKTVRNHLSRIYQKLKVANRTQAVVNAQRQGYL